jgi:hypothetical protein
MNKLIFALLLLIGIAGCSEEKKNAVNGSTVAHYKISVWGGGTIGPCREYLSEKEPSTANAAGVARFTDIDGRHIEVAGNWIIEEIK